MAVKLHRCRFEWLKTGPCWRVEKALKELGVDYELAPGPSRLGKRAEILAHTGQKLYPAIEFEDGTWYREESRDMEATIRHGDLMERAGGARATD
jgi:Glutathione S-transferase, N-terminal domain